MGKKVQPRINTEPSTAEGGHSPLADLLRAQGFSASPAPDAPAAPTPNKSAVGIDLAKMGKIVLRRERKGRGGKTVTIVSGLTLPPQKLDELSRTMRKALGCGSAVENGTIVLQGDIAPRAQEWLQKHGATKIVIGA